MAVVVPTLKCDNTVCPAFEMGAAWLSVLRVVSGIRSCLRCEDAEPRPGSHKCLGKEWPVISYSRQRCLRERLHFLNSTHPPQKVFRSKRPGKGIRPPSRHGRRRAPMAVSPRRTKPLPRSDQRRACTRLPRQLCDVLMEPRLRTNVENGHVCIQSPQYAQCRAAGCGLSGKVPLTRRDTADAGTAGS